MRSMEVEASVAAIASAMSPLGAIAVAVCDGQVIGVRFGHATEQECLASLKLPTPIEQIGDDAEEAGSDRQLALQVLDRLLGYADGEAVDLSDVPVAVGHLSTFQRRVVQACRAIPAGQQLSYGQVAVLAGSPGAARAVGQVMASNRIPLVVPCHRVVASGGGLGGFSAPQGLAMKRRLLALERIAPLT
jgi:methylated-DNA-[protein]-cysteine S-methyltransferase